MHPLVFLLFLLFQFIDFALTLYLWLILIYILLGLLTTLQIINPYKAWFGHVSPARILGGLARIVEPFLGRIRRYVKPIGSIDLSPIIAIILIQFTQYALAYYLTPLFIQAS